MNSITLIGTVAKDATVTLVDNFGAETPLLVFSFCDPGTPYQKGEPTFIDVHFMKAAAMMLQPYLVKGKPCSVIGKLKSKNFVTSRGDRRTKYFVSAECIQLMGRPPEKAAEENG